MNTTPRNQPVNVAASERDDGNDVWGSCRIWQVADKSANPRARGPGGTHYFSSLSGPTEAR
jgi:hypothetical protein